MRAPIVINSNFGPILHRFWDTATYLLKIAFFCYPCDCVIRHPRSLSSLWNFTARLSIRKLASWGYSVGRLRNPNFNRLWLIHPCDRQTDRRWHIARYSIYAVAHKKPTHSVGCRQLRCETVSLCGQSINLQPHNTQCHVYDTELQ